MCILAVVGTKGTAVLNAGQKSAVILVQSKSKEPLHLKAIPSKKVSF